MKTAGLAGLIIAASLTGPANRLCQATASLAEALRAKAEAGHYSSVERRQTGRSPSGDIILPIILAIEEARAPTSGDIRVLVETTRAQDARLRNAAIRTLGRLERRDVIPDLLPLLPFEATRAEAANALAQALRGTPLDNVPHGQHEQAVLEALLASGGVEIASRTSSRLTPLARSLGRLPYVSSEQFKSAEAFLRRVLETSFPPADEPHIGAARGLESLARLNRKISALGDDTVARLRTLAQTRSPNRGAQQRDALAALIAAQSVDADTLQVTLRDEDVEVRRLAVLSLSGSGSAIAGAERIDWIRESLTDSSFMVRFEAVRAWIRRGVPDHRCQPLIDVLNDRSLHVVIAALDALGDQCRNDQDITDRLTSEARTPPPTGSWQREAHALVALAKRAPDRAAIAMTAFVAHADWRVRVYAARAAAVLDDVQTLARLAADPEDGVVEAALPALRKRVGADSDAAFGAALDRRNRTTGRNEPARPYQVIRTAAMALEGAPSTPFLVTALLNALQRITAEQCDTSRDVRLALITRLGELGSVAQAPALAKLLKDFDPAVALAAATVVGRWTGKTPTVDLLPRPLRPPPTEESLRERASVLVEMESGRTFEIRFDTEQAPLARARFLELVSRPKPYYDGLTFHRIAPNFVIQGGSPGSDEYCGDCPFMRDEVGLAMHTRGTIGVSTRGRDTGDAQIFVNLVDNARLDHEYTVFGYVCRDSKKDGMDVVDEIQEGDRMRRLRVIAPGQSCR